MPLSETNQQGDAAPAAGQDDEETRAPLKENTKRETKVKGAKKSTAASDDGSKRSSPRKRSKSTPANNDKSPDEEVAEGKTKGAPKAKKAATAKKATTKTTAAETDDGEEPSPKKKAKKPEPQRLTERDTLPKLWDADKAAENGSYTYKIASWNVAGLRALLKKNPEVLSEFVKKHDLDVLCLQETKLQEVHLDDPKLKLRGHLLESDGFDAYYSCSMTKKGYSGTACFVKRRGKSNGKKNIASYFGKTSTNTKSPLPIDEKILIPEKVEYQLGKGQVDEEGRVISIDFPLFSMVNLYVPNSGQKLERLELRTNEWDQHLLEFMREKKAKRGLPVMWLGDLNVAHTNLEVWNDGAKHLEKQAGVTKEERASFQAQLDAGFVDAFRRLHPEAKGHYSYWSQRAGNREPNKGLRLDYFVCDPSFFESPESTQSKVFARDCYMDFDQVGSDHCPVVLELEIRP